MVAEGQVLHQLDVVVADELGGGGGVQVRVVRLVPHPSVHHRRWGMGKLSKQKGSKGMQKYLQRRKTRMDQKRSNKIQPVVPFNSLICVL